jgi:flagellar basal-body rod modification protein FlgD
MNESKNIRAQTSIGAFTDATVVTGTQKSGNSKQLDRSDFLNILVQQLKNQDPLEPMKNEEFAVNLAQFSQLEQLISINNNLSGSAGGGVSDVSSLAGYLGQEVLLADDTLTFTGGGSDSIQLNLPQATSGLFLELTKAGPAGQVERIALPGLEAGSHQVSLSGLGVADGDYTFSVKGVGVGGTEFSADALVVGTVSGFVPGPDAKLVIGDREVSPSLVKQVRVPSV